MKSLLVLFALMGTFLRPVAAQTRPTTQPASTAGPGSTTVATNRQQQLYDHYHSYSTKAGSEAAPVTTTPKRTDNQRSADGSAVPSTPTTGGREQSPSVAATEPTSPAGNASSRVRIGVRGGVTYPFYLEKPVGVGIDPAIGFVGGVVFAFGRGTVSFQPEVNYARHSQKSSDSYGTYTSANDYVEVPLLVKFSTGSYAGNRFFVNVGPYASYLASSSFEGRKLLLNSQRGRYGFGGALGIGAALKAGPGHVTVEVRGLYSLGNTDDGFSTDSRTILGEGTVGYIFPLGRSR